MKRSMGFIYSVTLLAGLMLFGSGTPVAAAEGSASMDRLERLERRVNEMAERQEQFMRRMGTQMERQSSVGQPGGEHRVPQLAPAGAPVVAAQPAHGARLAKSVQDMLRLLCFIGMLCNILLAIWIFTDIRKRGEGSGLFIALALVAGIPTAIIYTLTRIADKKV